MFREDVELLGVLDLDGLDERPPDLGLELRGDLDRLLAERVDLGEDGGGVEPRAEEDTERLVERLDLRGVAAERLLDLLDDGREVAGEGELLLLLLRLLDLRGGLVEVVHGDVLVHGDILQQSGDVDGDLAVVDDGLGHGNLPDEF